MWENSLLTTLYTMYYVKLQILNSESRILNVAIESFPAPNVFRIEFFLPGVPEMRNKKE
jgi:hypothetical protein